MFLSKKVYGLRALRGPNLSEFCTHPRPLLSRVLVLDWHAYIGLILLHVPDRFRPIGNTETMSDYLFRTYTTVSDVLHSRILSGDRFRM